jgi:hypothetical protein
MGIGRNAFNHTNLANYDFNGKIGYNIGRGKWFFTLEYSNYLERSEYVINRVFTLNTERKTTYFHTAGIGLMYYPSPDIQISTTFPVGVNLAIAYDIKLNKNNSLLTGFKLQNGMSPSFTMEENLQFSLFTKYRFSIRDR